MSVQQAQELPNIGFMTYPQDTVNKLFFKMPLLVFRMGLGWMLPPSFVVLTTYGRKSGLPRSTMVEHFDIDGTLYIASGWGTKAHWYRNLQANPSVTVQNMYGKIIHCHGKRITDGAELLDVFHKQNSPIWNDFLKAWHIDNDPDDFIAKKDKLHILRVDHIGSLEAPPPLATDLGWMIPVMTIIGVLSFILGWFFKK